MRASVVASRGFSACCSPALEHRLNSYGTGHSCSAECGIFPDQGLNLFLQHRQVILYHWVSREAPKEIHFLNNYLLRPQNIHYEYIILCWYVSGLDSKESAHNLRHPGSIPELGRPPGKGNGNPLQYSCLENSTDRGSWWVPSMRLQRVRHDWATNTFGPHTYHVSRRSVICHLCV